MLAEQSGSDDMCHIRCPMSEWSCSFPQQVSDATLLPLVWYWFLTVLNVSSFRAEFLFHYCTDTMMMRLDPRSCLDHLDSVKMLACPTMFSVVYWQGMRRWSGAVFLVEYALRYFSQCFPWTRYNHISISLIPEKNITIKCSGVLLANLFGN